MLQQIHTCAANTVLRDAWMCACVFAHVAGADRSRDTGRTLVNL